MENLESKIGRIAQQVSQKKLAHYTSLLRKHLLESGVPSSTFDDAAHTAGLELEIEESKENDYSMALSNYENRGIDTVGRIVVEFCFVRSSQGALIWPEYSDEDTLARWQFSDYVLPRPLMRYFLVSIRGSINDIDGFEADSFLFERAPETIDSIRQSVNDLIEEFKGPFGSGESSIDWPSVYNDKRFQRIALDLISNMRRKVEEQGLETYLEHLAKYLDMDSRSDNANLMQRPLTMADADQIARALDAAEKNLQVLTGQDGI